MAEFDLTYSSGYDVLPRLDPTLSGLKNDLGAAFSRVGPRTGQPFAELSNPVGIREMGEVPFPNNPEGVDFRKQGLTPRKEEAEGDGQGGRDCRRHGVYRWLTVINGG